MLDALPENVRKILLDYKFVVKYLQGRMSREDFLNLLNGFKDELLQKGLDREHFENLAYADPKSEFHRKAAYNRFVRFARKLGLDIATREDKIKWIKTISYNKFLDLLSVSAGLFSGVFSFLKWKDREKGVFLVASVMGDDIEPPSNSEELFKEFFLLMQREISLQNYQVWAVKLFFAIMCAHLFKDGNGRVARNSYFLLISQGLMDEEKSIKRGKGAHDAVDELLALAVVEMLRQEGINARNYYKDVRDTKKHITYYSIAEREPGDLAEGYTINLKFIAVKRALQSKGMYRGELVIMVGGYSESMERECEIEYQKVLVRWFWVCITIAERRFDRFAKLLNSSI